MKPLISPRLRAACSKVRKDPKSILEELTVQLADLNSLFRDTQKDMAWCAAHVEFLEREVQDRYSGPFLMFLIDDGEEHRVSAKSEDDAMLFYATEVCGYGSIDQYIEDMGEVEISRVASDTVLTVRSEESGIFEVKTAAEWAEVECDTLIASTVV